MNLHAMTAQRAGVHSVRGPMVCAPAHSRRVSVAARRRNAFDTTTDDGTPETVSHVVEQATAASNGFFTEGFQSALSGALSRNGTTSLLAGAERDNDEHRVSDQEGVLKAAIMSSKSTLLKLKLVQSEVEKAIAEETKQVERLMFALNKARNDAAYYRGLNSMMDGGTSD